MDEMVEMQQSEFQMEDGLRKRDLILRNPQGNSFLEEPESEKKHEFVSDFTQNCTMHGIRNIFKYGAGTCYRILWTVLLLSCIGVSLVQIVDRVIYYLGRPTTVNLAINYNNTLLFPAITFCNQNQIRATAAYNMSWYRLMEDISDGQLSEKQKLDSIRRHGVANMTLDEIFRPVAHTMKDMILTCRWGSHACSAENFTAIWTSLGLCYTFNSNASHQLNVISSGADNGLRLTLNVEEYEYMLESRSSAGLRVLLHNPQDFPDVKELGFASPAGSHSFIGLKVTELKNLPTPPANCKQEKLEFFDEYSTSTCKLECGTRLMAKACGCRLSYMPGKIDGVPVCNLSQYITCYLPERENIRTAQRNCRCAIPCQVLMFEPTVSLATHSDNKVKKLLSSKQISSIKRKFLHAREVVDRMGKNEMKKMRRMIFGLNNATSKVRNIIENELFDAINEQLESIENVSNSVETLYQGQDFLYGYQKYIVQKNFARVREAMDERTFTYVTFNFYEFVYKIKGWLRSLAATGQSSLPIDRMMPYYIIRDMVNAKMDNVRTALGNFSELHNSLMTGIGVFKYRYLDIPRSHNEFATPTPLLTRRLNKSPKHHKSMPECLNLMLGELENLSSILNDTWISGNFDEELFNNVTKKYIRNCKKFNSDASIFKSLTTVYAISVLDIRKSYLDLRMKTFRQVISDMKFLLTGLQTLLIHLRSSSFQNVFDGSEYITDYLFDANMTKMAFSDYVLGETNTNDMVRLKLFYEELRYKDMSIREKWDELAEAAIAVWDRVLRDSESRTYNEFANNTYLLRNITEVETEVKAEYISQKKNANLDAIIGRELDNLFMFQEQIVYVAKKFKRSTTMNEKFVKFNLLDLGIFYKQLSYEIITDQEAYGIFALFCNIGGSMGLLMGASVLTLSEVAEFVLVSSFLSLCRKLRTCCQNGSSQRQKVAEL